MEEDKDEEERRKVEEEIWGRISGKEDETVQKPRWHFQRS